jgi:hypothetical protein
MYDRGVRTLIFTLLMVGSAAAETPKAPAPKSGKEMLTAMEAVNRALGLESTPPPHCLKWGFGHQITGDEVRGCATKALGGQALPELGKSYVLAILMSAVGPQTIIAIALDAPGWAVLSCDPGKPCPPRKAGTDKMGKRVLDRTERACKLDTTIWIPAKTGCAASPPTPTPTPAPAPAPAPKTK